MNVFSEMGLREVVNANGKMTILGVSKASETVAEKVKKALQSFVVIEELIDYAGCVIAEKTGAQGGCPTAGAASGIAIACAACIAGTDLCKIEQLPNSCGLRNEIIIQKGHVVHFGGNIAQMMRLGGAVPIEVGCANKVEAQHVEGAITEKTAALFYTVSHHAVQKGMLSLDTILKIAARKGLPVIVDAAAEEDFTKYIAMGADLVVYSGAKALCGPTSGLICGRTELTEACKKQYRGIGRAMKVSKESMTGLITALREYEQDGEDPRQLQLSQRICDALSAVKGFQCRVVSDEAGRSIHRAELKIDSAVAKITAETLNERLKARNPAIYLRDHYARLGILLVDTRSLDEGEESLIISAIKEILEEVQHA